MLDGEAPLVGDLRLQRRYQVQPWTDVERIIHCESCRAELTTHHHLSQKCVFCDSKYVLVEEQEGALKQPDGFLPFSIDREQATEAIHQAQRAGLRRFATWLTGKEQRVVSLQGVYVPFWVFDGFVDVRTWAVKSALARHSPTGDAPVEGKMMFDRLTKGCLRWKQRRLAPPRGNRNLPG